MKKNHASGEEERRSCVERTSTLRDFASRGEAGVCMADFEVALAAGAADAAPEVAQAHLPSGAHRVTEINGLKSAA